MAWVQKLDSGQYQVVWRDPDDRRRSRTFATAKDARTYKARIETELDSGLYLDPEGPRMLLRDWAATWLAAHVTGRARTANLDVMFRVHILPALGHLPLGRVTPLACQSFVRERTDAGKSPATVYKIAQALKQVLTAAVRNDLLSRNPADGLVLPRVDADQRMFLSQAQLDHLLAVCAEMQPAWYPLVHTAAYTGMRWGEVTALRRDDADLLRRRLHVVQAAIEVRGKLTYGPPKGSNSRRVVAIDDDTCQVIARHLEHPFELVFCGARGAAAQRGLFRSRFWVPLTKEAGLRGLRFHDLRHTHISLLIANGADIKVIQNRVGHARASMTLDRYGHARPDAGEAALLAIARSRSQSA